MRNFTIEFMNKDEIRMIIKTGVNKKLNQVLENVYLSGHHNLPTMFHFKDEINGNFSHQPATYGNSFEETKKGEYKKWGDKMIPLDVILNPDDYPEYWL